MRYLVTGGAGFVGSHIAEALLDRGDEVRVIDDLSTGGVDNIQHLKGLAHFQYVFDSITSSQVMKELVDWSDCVLHLAAAVGVRLIVDSPVRTIETNVKGTEFVLELAAKKSKPVTIFSTSEVYGKSNRSKFSEVDDLVLGPTSKARWSYAASKILDEFLALAYAREKSLPVIIIRLFNTVGPRQTGRYGMVVPRFVESALAGRPITVYGDGRQTRTFTHVKDVVRATLALVDHPEACGEIFNIGGREEISIESLAKMVKTLLESPSEIEYVPYAEAFKEGFEDMQRRVPDLSKTQALVGYEPEFGIEDIIMDVAAYQRARLTPAW
jgi:UDP-glucose 4-epimerase